MERFLDYSLQVLKRFTEGKGRNLGLILAFFARCDVYPTPPPPLQLWNSDKNQVKFQLKFWYFQVKFGQ
jgi:hypothetical protein